MKEVRSIPNLSKETGVPQYSIRKLVKDGKLEVLKVGNKWFVPVASFEALFKKEKTGLAHE